MSEKATTRALMAVIPEQDPQRIESRGTGPGIPDIWCGDCAIETKCLRSYPKGDSSLVTLDHKLTLPQYRWLSRRWRAGYKAFVVLQAKRVEWYLFSAPDSFILTDGNEVTRHQLKRQALWWSTEGLVAEGGMAEFGFTINSWLSMPWSRIEELRKGNGLVARWKDV